jgi:hypothetical protein
MQLPDVGLLDFRRAEAIYSVGYEAGLRYADSIRSRLAARRPAGVVAARRRAYCAGLPPFRVDTLCVTGVTEAQRRYVLRHFSQRDWLHLRRGYYRLASDDRTADFTLRRAVDSVGRQALHMDLHVRRHLDLRLGGLLTTLRHSRLYLGAGYRALRSVAGQVDVDLQLGQNYRSAVATLRAEVPARHPFAAAWSFGWRQQRYGERDFILPRGYPSASLRTDVWASEWAVEVPWGRHGLCRPLVGVMGLDDRSEHFAQSATLARTGFDLRWGIMAPDAYADRGYDLLLGLRRQAVTGGAPWWTLSAGAVGYLRLSSRLRWGLHVRGVWSDLRTSSPLRTWLLSPQFTPSGYTRQRLYALLRARRYVAPGVSPVWRWGSRGQVRLDAYAFLSERRPVWVGEWSLVYRTAPADCVAFVHLCHTDRTSLAVGFRLGFLPAEDLFGR